MVKKPQVILQIFILVLILYFRYFNQASRAFFDQYPIVLAFLSFVVYYLFIKFLSLAIIAYYSKRHKIPFKKKNNVHFGIENIANILIAFGLIGLVLRVLGVNPFEIITSATIVAAAIALVTRDYIADFFSGIYLSFSNTFEIGDYVKLDNHKGRIVEIGMLKIKILNDDDDVVILPNFKVYFNEIINYTRRDVRLISIDFELALDYVVRIDELKESLKLALRQFEEYIDQKSFAVKVVEMKSDFVSIKFQYKLKRVDANLQRDLRRQTTREVFNYISMQIQKRNVLTNKQLTKGGEK